MADSMANTSCQWLIQLLILPANGWFNGYTTCQWLIQRLYHLLLADSTANTTCQAVHLHLLPAKLHANGCSDLVCLWASVDTCQWLFHLQLFSDEVSLSSSEHFRRFGSPCSLEQWNNSLRDQEIQVSFSKTILIAFFQWAQRYDINHPIIWLLESTFINYFVCRSVCYCN